MTHTTIAFLTRRLPVLALAAGVAASIGAALPLAAVPALAQDTAPVAKKTDRLPVLGVYACLFGNAAHACAQPGAAGLRAPIYTTLVSSDPAQRTTILERVPAYDEPVASGSPGASGPQGDAPVRFAFAYQ